MTESQLERTIRRIRQRIFDYYEESEKKGQKASRILSALLSRLAHYRKSLPVDQFGATAEDRRSLAKHGMAWGD